MRRTKVLATLGPASSDPSVIASMVEAGMDGARLNFSHGTAAEHFEVAEAVRAAADKLRRPVALLQDLQGPKIRLRSVEGDAMVLEAGTDVRVDASQHTGTPERLTVDEPLLIEGVSRGTALLLGDGDVRLKVTDVDDDHDSRDHIMARVVEGGTVRSNMGILARGLALPGGLSTKDQEDLLLGREIGVDYVAASFVASATDVADVKEFLAGKGETTPVIAKIERLEALDNLAEIVEAADGILVARGDLGLALEPEQVPVAQKRMLRECARRGALSITATQMLESMTQKSRPTRAEASDVANAIFDGSHVVMLSGETAIGVDPARAVGTMARICAATERAILSGDVEAPWDRGEPDGSREDAIAGAAVQLAEELDVEAIVCFTSSGSTALRVAKYRPAVPVIGASPEPATLCRLALVWGVHPTLVPDAETLDRLVYVAEEAAKEAGLVEPGDALVLTAGEIGVPGTTNLIRYAQVH